MSTRTLLLALAASVASMPVSSPVTDTVAPLTSRDVIAHDAVVGFPETVPDSTLGQLYLAYQPYLYVEGGCVPFPAVDAEGNTRFVVPALHFSTPSSPECKGDVRSLVIC
jgi:hypothetical protein